MNELKPCPFCGEKPVEHVQTRLVKCCYAMCDVNPWVVGVDLWNNRVSHDKLTEQNKMLREALESICRMDNYVYADVVARKALEATK